LALVQYLVLVNPRHSKGSLWGSEDENEFEYDYLPAGTYNPDIKGCAWLDRSLTVRELNLWQRIWLQQKG